MLYKIILILLLIILFYLIITNNIEKFTNKNYTNTNEYSWKRNEIRSSLPYDIILKSNNNNYYDYGNDEIEEKMIKLFNIDSNKVIKNIEGIKWSRWKYDDNNYNIYNKILIYLDDKFKDKIFDLPNNKNKFNIQNYSIIRYKYNIDNPSTILFELDILIYRLNKPLARHIKFLIISNGIYNNVIMAKVVGVINECDMNQKLDVYDDNNKYQEYEPEFKFKYDMNSFIFDTNDKLINSAIEYELYNKLLKEL